MTKRLLTPLLLGIVLLGSPLRAQQVIKFATVAPEGSTWMNVMKEYDQAIRTESGGQIGFKIYAGGVQGDEPDVLRKIKLGQLHSTGITGVGMTSIAPKARILDAPFLFHSYDEVDQITSQFDTELKQAFLDGGFVNLGWAEVGWTYLYTNIPVSTQQDMKKVKMWMWQGDPIAEAAFGALDIHPISLALPDVLTSLQTGLVDGVYAPPLGVIALQWFSRVKYMVNTPIADAAGAVVISKKKFDELSPANQEILLRNGRKFMAELTRRSREDNAKSVETLKKNGIRVTEMSPAEVARLYDVVGKQGRKLLVGKLYSQDLLDRVEKALGEFRSKHAPR